MLPLECHQVARIRCDEYFVSSLQAGDVRLTEHTPLGSVRLAANLLKRTALGLVEGVLRAALRPLRV